MEKSMSVTIKVSPAPSETKVVWATLCFIIVISCLLSRPSLRAQTSTTYRSPLIYGYQADPMMVTTGGRYYLYSNDQMGYNRLRKSRSLAGLAGSSSEVLYVGDGTTVGPAVSCGYIIQWQGLWYQYCGDANGSLVLQSSTSDPAGAYTFLGRTDNPTGYTTYAKWPILVNNQLYMVATINGEGTTYNAIYAAKFSDPVTRTGPWNLITVPTGGAGSWECAHNRCIDEGGSAVVHGSQVFFLFSAGGYEDPDYCVGMLTANITSDLSLQSSWTKSSGCVISRNDSVGAYGPGSALWFKSPDGTQDWLAFHVKTTTTDNRNGDDRRLEAIQVTWDTSGNPVFPQPYALDTYQTLPSGDTGNEFTAPFVSSWSSSRINLHAIGAGNAIWENYWTTTAGTWSGWHQVGSIPPNGAAIGPVAVSRISNYIDMFVPTDSKLYTQTWNGSSWSTSWSNMAGPSPTTSPEENTLGGCCVANVNGSKVAASTWSSSRIDIFVVGDDHNVWQNYWASGTGWSGYQSLGQPPASRIGLIGAPAATSRMNNSTDIFARAADGNIYQDSWNGSSWSGWSMLGATPAGNASSPAVANWGTSNLQIYERGRDGNIYQIVWNGTAWGSWTNLGAPTPGGVSDPTAVSRTNNYTDLFTRATDGNIYQSTWNGSIWSAWTSVGSP